jgi:ubiquinone/menaquinone biosynthesis C-methylase UbiE
MKGPVITAHSDPIRANFPVHATTIGMEDLRIAADSGSTGHNDTEPFTVIRIPGIPCLDLSPDDSYKPKLKPDISQPTAPYGGRVKYTEDAARKYQLQKLGKHRAEMALIDRAFGLIPKSHRVLDVPCGGGRVSLHLSGRGHAMSLGDLSEAMLDIARENISGAGLKCPVERQDIEALSYEDRAFDTTVSFRLFHHFPNPEIRRRAIKELCRVTGKFVVISYLSTKSVTAVRRKLQAALGGKKSSKYSTPLAQVRGYFEESGFGLVRDFAEMPIIHTLHLAVFRRLE